MSLKDQISAYGSDLKVKKLDIEGLNEFYIREMSAGDREKVETDNESEDMKHKLRAAVFVKSVCDKSGTLLYTDEDINEVNGYRMKLLSKVFTESNALNGITLVEADAVAEEVKNS